MMKMILGRYDVLSRDNDMALSQSIDHIRLVVADSSSHLVYGQFFCCQHEKWSDRNTTSREHQPFPN